MTSDGIANGRCLGRYWSIGAVTRTKRSGNPMNADAINPALGIVALVMCSVAGGWL